MPPPTLITGSLAYDTIMVFDDQFQNHILPQQVHILNVCFEVPQLRREFGGCAGNIAYNLKLLGGDPLPIGTVGKDFAPYREWLTQHQIPATHIHEIPDTFTAQAFLTTDRDNNQIIAFHPGAMQHAARATLDPALANQKPTLAIVAPNDKTAMLQYTTQLSNAKIPFIFDPGQGLPRFTPEDLNHCIAHADHLVVNDYEAELLQQKTNQTLPQLAARLKTLIVTRGAKGAEFHREGKTTHHPAAAISEAKDPTGCGDAFRAGLLYGISKNLDWQTTAQLATLLGAIKIEHPGTQNHHFTKTDFATRYHREFGTPLNLD